MDKNQIEKIILDQRKFFETGATLEISFRISMLKKLKAGILKHLEEIHNALKSDLGKSSMESYMCETGLSLSELDFMIRNVKKFSRSKKVKTPLVHFKSSSRVIPSPYGVVLIMSPWNYPFLLSIEPLIDAIAAGNTVVLKPSAYSSETSHILKNIIEESFEPNMISVIEGGREENEALLEEKFNYIFFTGSKNVGKIVMEKASKFLTPVTLELGGKSPCIVDCEANVKIAAKRIVFGKFINCGQTCVAPDYILVHKNIKNQFIQAVKSEIISQFGTDPLNNENYGKIINKKHFLRILSLIQKEKLVHGGNYNENSIKIEPTVLDNVDFSDPVMLEEIFGPIMPVLSYTDSDKIIEKINSMESPLAFYIFTENKNTARRFINLIHFGGGCVNDTIVHLATSSMGFGGFGESGMGTYHGQKGFETFTHYKSILNKSTKIDLDVRYQPYSKKKENFVKKFLK